MTVAPTDATTAGIGATTGETTAGSCGRELVHPVFP
jgi:hypothetical protein